MPLLAWLRLILEGAQLTFWLVLHCTSRWDIARQARDVGRCMAARRPGNAPSGSASARQRRALWHAAPPARVCQVAAPGRHLFAFVPAVRSFSPPGRSQKGPQRQGAMGSPASEAALLADMAQLKLEQVSMLHWAATPWGHSHAPRSHTGMSLPAAGRPPGRKRAVQNCTGGTKAAGGRQPQRCRRRQRWRRRGGSRQLGGCARGLPCACIAHSLALQLLYMTHHHHHPYLQPGMKTQSLRRPRRRHPQQTPQLQPTAGNLRQQRRRPAGREAAAAAQCGQQWRRRQQRRRMSFSMGEAMCWSCTGSHPQ